VNSVLPSVLGQDSIEVVDVSTLGKAGQLIKNMDKGYELFHGKILDRMIACLADTQAFQLEKIPFLARPELFGGFWEEIYCDMPEAMQTESWNVGDEHYAPSIPGIYKPELTVKAYGRDIESQSYRFTMTDRLLSSAFLSNEGLNTYFTVVATAVSNKMGLDILNLARLVRAKLVGTVLNTPNTESRINVLSLYKTNFPDDEDIDEDNCWTNKNFLRFLAETFASYSVRLTKNPTSHYINEKTEAGTDYVRQCTNDDLVFEVLTDVVRKIRFNLEADVFNPEKLNFGDYNEVLFWQAEGDNSLGDYSTISVKLGVDDEESDIKVTQKGVVGIMYDKRSIIETYRDPYTWTFRNQAARYTDYGYETNLGWAYKLSYPVICFIVADEENP
jgi:hypothetical protein